MCGRSSQRYFLSKRKHEKESAKGREIIVDIPLTLPVGPLLPSNRERGSLCTSTPSNQPQHLLTALQRGATVNERKGSQRGQFLEPRSFRANPVSRVSRPLWSSCCPRPLKPRGCSGSGFVSTIHNASLGGDRGRTSAVRQQRFQLCTHLQFIPENLQTSDAGWIPPHV